MSVKKIVESIKLYPGEGGVTAPVGFVANGISCGIKTNGAKDLAIIFSRDACNAAGIFTNNRIKGAPLKVSKANLGNKIHAIVANSGNANSCTGKEGVQHVREIGKRFSEEFDIPANSILFASTGVIGIPLPMESIVYGISKLKRKLVAENNSRNAADAIMMNDTKRKMAKVTCIIGGKLITIGAIAKGSGMINPNLATMLTMLTTDANIAPKMMQRALRSAAKHTFNKMTIDGQMSTNDCVFLIANGRQNNQIINRTGVNYSIFEQALIKLCECMAFEIVNDGEGVTKVITITVKGATTKSEAETVAREIAGSVIFKTGMYGQTACWGNIVQAIGATDVPINPDKINIFMNGVQVCENGMYNGIKPADGRTILNKRSLQVTIDIGMGRASDWIITTDLSYDYVKINSQYI